MSSILHWTYIGKLWPFVIAWPLELWQNMSDCSPFPSAPSTEQHHWPEDVFKFISEQKLKTGQPMFELIKFFTDCSFHFPSSASFWKYDNKSSHMEHCTGMQTIIIWSINPLFVFPPSRRIVDWVNGKFNNSFLVAGFCYFLLNSSIALSFCSGENSCWTIWISIRIRQANEACDTNSFVTQHPVPLRCLNRWRWWWSSSGSTRTNRTVPLWW